MNTLAEILSTNHQVKIDDKTQRVPCLAHIINLAVGAFLDNLKVIENEANQCTTMEDINTLERGKATEPKKDFALIMLKIREIAKVLSHNI
jgi:hypothetical protein